MFAGVPAPAGADAPGTTETSQVAIVDARGNALSMTTTINLNFGSWLMPHGFFLNNALTNFSSAHGKGAPNAMAPNKRPVTSMAPTMVFDSDGRLALVTGSAGGGYIVDYIAQAVVGILAWRLRPPTRWRCRTSPATAAAARWKRAEWRPIPSRDWPPAATSSSRST
ncbi:gamma-glutamyltransferase [Achromobacter xylosoxidans]